MQNHALEGIKVVDLTSYIAGSYGPMLLADLGAEVVKVEAPVGDAFRALLGGFLGWNRGKRGIVVDLRNQDGREVVYDMVRRADIVAENFRPGVAQRLGMDYETLRQVNPRIIYSSANGYGSSGPYIELPAFDPLLQARSGAMATQGGPGHPPVFLTVAITDYCTAMLSAFAMVSALYVRERTGLGQRVETNLTNAAIVFQSSSFIFYDGKPSRPQGGPDFIGWGPTHRLYATADGWMALDADTEARWAGLCRALSEEALDHDPRFATATQRKQNEALLTARLEAVFARRSTEEWLSHLHPEDVPCAPVLLHLNLISDPHYAANDFIATHQHPEVGEVKQTGVLIKFSETPGKLWGPAPLLGQHTVEVLQEMDYSQGRIQELLTKRVIFQAAMPVTAPAD